LVNARKKPKKKKHDNKYSYNVRYYFTSAKVTLLNTNSPSNVEAPRSPTTKNKPGMKNVSKMININQGNKFLS